MDLHHLLLAGLPAHSGLPRTTDIIRPVRLVRFVPLRARIKMKRGRKWGKLKSLGIFLRISLRSSAYSSTIRRASSVREDLLGFSGPEGVRHLAASLNGLLNIGSPPATHGTPLFVCLDIDQ